MLEKSELNVNGVFDRVRKFETVPRSLQALKAKQEATGNSQMSLDPSQEMINQMKAATER